MAGGRETHVQPHFTSPSQRSLGTRNEGLWKQRIFQSKILGLTVFMYVIIVSMGLSMAAMSQDSKNLYLRP